MDISFVSQTSVWSRMSCELVCQIESRAQFRSEWQYPLVNVYGKSPFLMGRWTISMAIFKFAKCLKVTMEFEVFLQSRVTMRIYPCFSGHQQIGESNVLHAMLMIFMVSMQTKTNWLQFPMFVGEDFLMGTSEHIQFSSVFPPDFRWWNPTHVLICETCSLLKARVLVSLTSKLQHENLWSYMRACLKVLYTMYTLRNGHFTTQSEDHQILSTLSDKATCFRHEGDLLLAKYSDFDIESVAQASNSVANFESPHDTRTETRKILSWVSEFISLGFIDFRLCFYVWHFYSCDSKIFQGCDVTPLYVRGCFYH